MGTRGIVIWITGLPGSGKSALADAVSAERPGMHVLRMDDLRKIVTPDPTYSEQERECVYRSLVHMAHTLSRLGHDVIIDATGNMRRWRDLCRSLCARFAEVYLYCPLEVCVQREAGRTDRRGAPADVYARAVHGAPVPGAGAPYEPPLSPELTLASDTMGVYEEARRVLDLMDMLRRPA